VSVLKLDPFIVFLDQFKKQFNIQQDSIKCFISYTWYPDNLEQNRFLDEFLTSLKYYLQLLGFKVFLDVFDIHGHNRLRVAIQRGIEESDFILPICTPSYNAQTKQNDSIVAYEFKLIQEKGSTKSTSVIPIIKEGDMTSSVPVQLQAYTNLYFMDVDRFYEKMISLKTGLIPTIFKIDMDDTNYITLTQPVCQYYGFNIV